MPTIIADFAWNMICIHFQMKLTKTYTPSFTQSNVRNIPVSSRTSWLLHKTKIQITSWLPHLLNPLTGIMKKKWRYILDNPSLKKGMIRKIGWPKTVYLDNKIKENAKEIAALCKNKHINLRSQHDLVWYRLQSSDFDSWQVSISGILPAKVREGNAKMKGTRRESGGIGEKGGKKWCRRRSALSSRDKKSP